MKNVLRVLIFLLLTTAKLNAQSGWGISVTTVATPPYPLSLDGFVAEGVNKISVQVNCTNLASTFNLPNHPARISFAGHIANFVYRSVAKIIPDFPFCAGCTTARKLTPSDCLIRSLLPFELHIAMTVVNANYRLITSQIYIHKSVKEPGHFRTDPLGLCSV